LKLAKAVLSIKLKYTRTDAQWRTYTWRQKSTCGSGRGSKTQMNQMLRCIQKESEDGTR